MVGWSQVTGSMNVSSGKHLSHSRDGYINNSSKSAYPWGELPYNTTICDIGSGSGHIPLSILKTFPSLKAIMQDLPPVLEDAKEVSNHNIYLISLNY